MGYDNKLLHLRIISTMSNFIKHRNTRIVTLQLGEDIGVHCTPGDIVIVPDGDAWWTHFIDEVGEIDCYDAPFPSYGKALGAAKAAAEFAAE